MLRNLIFTKITIFLKADGLLYITFANIPHWASQTGYLGFWGAHEGLRQGLWHMVFEIVSPGDSVSQSKRPVDIVF